MSLELNNIQLQHGHQTVVQDLSLQLADGQIGCLLGPSGSGKTTLLRAIAGFSPVSQGSIHLHGRCLSSPGNTVEPAQRGIGIVLQDLALMPHLTVAGNIVFGLHRASPATRQARLVELLELTQLNGLAQRHPHELSGGQRQRVALARALAPRPRLLLLDEPFSSLDQSLRLHMAQRVSEIVEQAGVTTLVVTHDQHEAFAMGERVGLIDQGQLRQWDSAYALYHRPACRQVAHFIGDGVWLPGEVNAEGQILSELGVLGPAPQFVPGDKVDILLRPDDVLHDDASPQQAEVISKAFRGAQILYQLGLPSGQHIKALVPSHHNHALGEKIGYRLELDDLIAFPSLKG